MGPPPPAGAPLPPPSTAAAVLGELQRRYAHWRARNVAYGRLLAFVSFIALLLAVLFLQRSSHASYEVHSTLAAGLLPPGPVAGLDDVYAWLRGLLGAVWRDPVCGDGVCESPFEFAQYGRFGCRADCGRLQDVQNLTALRVDLAYDFAHPAGSLPPADLLAQAAWNLCPAGDASGCYWAADQPFEQLAGAASIVVPDVPDGAHAAAAAAAVLLLGCWVRWPMSAAWWKRPAALQLQTAAAPGSAAPTTTGIGCHRALTPGHWALVVKRDIFRKVAGAVRILPLLERQATAAKVAAAAAAAAASRASERAALEAAEELGSHAGLALVDASLVAQHAAGADAAAVALAAGTLGAADYLAELAALDAQLAEDQAELAAASAGCPDLPFYQPGAEARGPPAVPLASAAAAARRWHACCRCRRYAAALDHAHRWPAPLQTRRYHPCRQACATTWAT